MLRSTIILGLVATVLSGTIKYDKQYIRLGNVDDSLIYLSGLLVPVESTFADDVPTYEFRSAVTGAPVAESDHYNYRCSIMEDYIFRDQKPSLLCRNVDYVEEDAPTADTVKPYFILSADQLAPDVKEINLLFGKTTYHSFIAANPSLSVPEYGPGNAELRALERPYDSYGIISSNHPFSSILEHASVLPNIRDSEQHNIQAAYMPLPTMYF